jgi:hypothetical protein
LGKYSVVLANPIGEFYFWIESLSIKKRVILLQAFYLWVERFPID